MEKYVKNMMEEHAQLVKRIVALDDYIYSDKSDNDDKVEFANKCIQLAAMRQYERSLGARLENAGIVFIDGEYLEKVAQVSQEEEKEEGAKE